MPTRTFARYRSSCATWAIRLVGIDDILDADDPYELAVVMKDAFDQGVPAQAFIRDIFAEDLASTMNDSIMAAEAEETGET